MVKKKQELFSNQGSQFYHRSPRSVGLPFSCQWQKSLLKFSRRMFFQIYPTSAPPYPGTTRPTSRDVPAIPCLQPQKKGTLQKVFSPGPPRVRARDSLASGALMSQTECTTPSHSQSLANFVANVHSQGISAARTKFSQFHSQNHSHSLANSFATLNSQLFL